MLPRHHLVWLNRRSWRDPTSAVDDEIAEVVAGWIERGFPAVVRRHADGDTRQGVALGIALPLSQGRRRIALQARGASVQRCAPPPRLGRVIASAPDAWRASLGELDASFAQAKADARVYGSLAWQHLTGQAYLTPGSDVDMLLAPADRSQLERVLVLLQRWEAASGLRADGEIVLPAGGEVAWRELKRGRGKVLVKSPCSLALRPVAELLQTWPEPTAA